MPVASSPSNVDWEKLTEDVLGDLSDGQLPPWVKLPALPSVVTECMQIARAPDVAPVELAEPIQKDAGLTCLILRHINSSLFGFRHPARNVFDAVARLGVRAAVRFLVTSTVNEVMKSSKSKLINFNAFWCSNLERALFAREVAILLGADEGTAYSAAMLCDCLLPVVTNRSADDYVEFITDQAWKKEPIVNFENDRFGWDHSMATSMLLRGWNFPPEVIYCTRMHHSGLEILKDEVVGTSAAAAVAIAALLPDQLQQEPTGLADLTRLESAWPSFNLHTLAEKVHEQFQELSPDINNPFPLHRRLPKLEEAVDAE